jgi:flotillin
MLASSLRRTTKNALNKNIKFINFAFNDNNDKDKDKYNNCKGIKRRNYTMTSVVSSVVVGSGLIGTSYLLSTRYYVAKPNEMLSCTGPFINDSDGIKIGKTMFLWPFQTVNVINLQPKTYIIIVSEAMSLEKIAFNMPTVFTIGPDVTYESLKKYAKFLQSTSSYNVEEIVCGIVKGETRMAAGKISLDNLFNNKPIFKDQIITGINDQLEQFGLKVYNANIEELKDMPGTNYFGDLKQKALQSASNKAKVDVAEQQAFGDIGEAEHKTKSRQQLAHLEQIALSVENEKERENSKSRAELSIAKAQYDKEQQIAKIEADAESEKRKIELQIKIETQRIQEETERLRATLLAKASVDAEIAIKKAEGIADAFRKEADGKAYATRVEADAEFVKKTNEALGIAKIYEAESDGLKKLMESAGGLNNLNAYLALKTGAIVEIAEHQSNALKNMKPKITIIDSKEGNGMADTITSFMNSAVPILNTLPQNFGVDILKNFRNPKK